MRSRQVSKVVVMFIVALVLAAASARRKRYYDGEKQGRRHDGGQHTSLQHYLSSPFNLTALVALREDNSCTGMFNGKVKNKMLQGKIANLAIARTGSDSVSKALRANSQAAHHNHDCTLSHLANAGAKRVVVSLRDPVARIISGYQRRMSNSGRGKSQKFANAEFRRLFSAGGVDDFISALRLPDHPRHKGALMVTYGQKRQSYMLPLFGFYWASSNERSQEKGDITVEVRFLCTATLSADFSAAGTAWGVDFEPMDASAQNNKHRSAVYSDVVASTSGNKTSHSLVMSVENRAWITEIYKRDLELVDEHCSGHDTAVMGGQHGSSVAVFVCPAGENPGTCHMQGRGRQAAPLQS